MLFFTFSSFVFFTFYTFSSLIRRRGLAGGAAILAWRLELGRNLFVFFWERCRVCFLARRRLRARFPIPLSCGLDDASSRDALHAASRLGRGGAILPPRRASELGVPFCVGATPSAGASPVCCGVFCGADGCSVACAFFSFFSSPLRAILPPRRASLRAGGAVPFCAGPPPSLRRGLTLLSCG